MDGDTVTLNEANSWTYTWEELAVYADGTEIAYSVDEPAVPDGYNPSITMSGDAENGYEVTVSNKHTPEKTSVTVTKEWDDADDQDGKRPDNFRYEDSCFFF